VRGAITIEFAVCVLLVVMTGCEAGAGRGRSCRRPSECDPSLVCALGRCRAACRESRDCEVGARCLVEPATGVAACSLPTIDACGPGGCASGFTCSEGECVNECASLHRCPDGVCEENVCVPTRRPESDAAVDAARDDDAGAGCHGPGCDPVIAIDRGSNPTSGAGTTMVVTESGALWGWGATGGLGLLGDRVDDHGSCFRCASIPVQALGPDGAPFANVVDVGLGDGLACAVLADGSVWCWGDGALGDAASPRASRAPSRVLALEGGSAVPLTDAVEVAIATHTACVIRGTAREAWCWGGGSDGTLATGALDDAPVAVRATELPAPLAELSAEYSHVVARTEDGRVIGVGYDTCRVLGGGVSGTVEPHAILAPVDSVVTYATATWGTCAVSTSGALACWGLVPIFGQPTTRTPCPGCGSGMADCTATPVALDPSLTPPFVRLRAGDTSAFLGITGDGRLYAWGSWGSSSDTSIDFALAPTRIALPGNVEVVDAIAGGGACAVTRDGDVLCAGLNTSGELGRGTVGGYETAFEAVVWP
jgi:hypothetical protein